MADIGKILAGLLVTAGILAVAKGSSAQQNTPKPSPKKFDYVPPGGSWVNGIDVNYVVDWPIARDDVNLGFAICKAGQGAPGQPRGFNDSTFATNRVGMINALHYWGAYWYAILSQPAKPQAQALIKQIGKQSLERMLPPSVDLEWQYNDGQYYYGTFFPKPSKQQLIDWLYEFNEEIKNGIGRKPMAYTAAGWWNDIGDPVDPIQQAYALWVASWTSAGKPSMPKGFAGYDIWQFSAEKGPFADVGIKGTPQYATAKKSVDRDRFPGTLDDMGAFIKASIL